MLPITSLYVIIFGIIFLILSARTILARQAANVSLGDGGDQRLQRRIRVHGNFAEYVPFILFILLLAELNSAPVVVLQSIGVLLVVGRIAHIISVDSDQPSLVGRTIGMALTFTALGIGLAALAWQSWL